MSTNPNILKTDAATMAKLFPPDKQGEPRVCEVCSHTYSAILMHSETVCNSCNADGLRVAELESAPRDTEMLWNDIKAKRNQLLNDTLWTIQDDSPLTPANRAEFAQYRRALHRLTVDFTNPDDVVWPTIPNQVF